MEYTAFLSGENKEAFPDSINEVLEREFDKEEIEKRAGGFGKEFYYPRGEAVIGRLNEAFGSCWSFCVKEYFKDSQAEDTIVVLGELIINHPKYPLRVIQQFAGKPIMKNKQGGVVNIANDYKSGASLALRKCAMQIGVGLYLTKGLPDEDLLEGAKTTNSAPTAQRTPASPAPSTAVAGGSEDRNKAPKSESGAMASDRQVNFAKALYKKKGLTEEVDFENLTAKAASDYIGRWKELPDATGAPTPAPTSVAKKEVKKPVVEPEPVSDSPTEESDTLKRFRVVAAEIIGQDDPQDPTVEKFILHVYKNNFSKELESVSQITEKELVELVQSIDMDE